MTRHPKTYTADDARQLDLFSGADEVVAPPVPAAHGAMRRLLISGQVIDYALRRSKRRSIGFMISDDGLRISAPRWVTIADIEAAIVDKQRWILTKLHERRQSAQQRSEPRIRWGDGATLPYLGQDLVVRLDTEAPDNIAFDAGQHSLTLSMPQDTGEQQLKNQVQQWLQDRASAIFAERLPLYAEKLGVTYQSFALSSATTQWGSCTSAGKIRLNWRLVHFSLPLIDYVIAHELSHLREMNHSPRFWATVESVFPDFASAKRMLQKRSREIMPLF